MLSVKIDGFKSFIYTVRFKCCPLVNTCARSFNVVWVKMQVVRSIFKLSGHLIRSNFENGVHSKQNILNLLAWNRSNLVNSIQSRGFRDKGVLELRCDACKFKKIDDRWWVLCDKFPRHKQREQVMDVKRRWIVTHVTRNGRPFQKKAEAYILKLCPPGGYDYRNKILLKDRLD